MCKNKDIKTANVPPLRFPGFTDDWKMYKLKELCKMLSGGTPALDNQKFWNGEIPFISASAMHFNYITDSELHLTKEGLTHGSKLLKKNNLLLLVRGSMLWKHIPICYNLLDIAFNQDVKGIIINNQTDSLFMLYWFEAHERRIKYMVTGTGIGAGKLDTEDLLSMNVLLPHLNEQNKIYSLFRLLDERIAIQSKIIDDLKKLKSAIIEELYSEVTGDTFSYSELFTVITERNSKRLYNKVIAASQEYGMVDRESLNLKVQFDEDSINTYKIIQSGDYVIHLRSFQGGFAFSRLQGICSPAYIILRPNNRVEYSYFENYFISSKFINSLQLVTYGIRDGRSINVEEWLSMKVTLPSKKEQKRIISTIQSVHLKLKNEQDVLSSLSKQRSYLLKEMFI